MSQTKPIPGMPGYLASIDGYLLSIKGKRNPVRILRSQEERDGRLRVSLRTNGVIKRYLVHKLIALTFLGECPPEMPVNHINGDHKDNRPSNLEYVTARGNYDHAIEHGLHPRGDKNNKAVLRERDVRYIRMKLKNGYRGVGKELAQKYGVPTTLISQIKRGKAWKWLDKV